MIKSFWDFFKTPYTRLLERLNVKLEAENAELRAVNAELIERLLSSWRVAAATGAYEKCSNCEKTVARFEKQPDGRIICANCDGDPRAQQTADKPSMEAVPK